MSSDTPTAAQEWRAHWPTVFAAGFGMSFSTIYVYSAGGLTQPLEQEFGWSRAAIGSGITVLTITGALLGPIMGAAVDRFGSRRIAIPGVIAFCLAFAALSLATPSLWTWWLLWFLLALFGVGIKPAVWTTAVTSLFRKSRGLALAITLCGASIGSIFTPLLTNWLVDHHGWRGAYIGLPLVWGLIGFPLIFFGLRSASDKHRRSVSRNEAVKAAAPVTDGPTVRGSIFSRRFAALLVAAMAFALLSVSLIVSLVPALSSHGIPRGAGAQIAATTGITAVIGRITTGWLLDRFDPRFISAFTMALPISTLVLLLTMPGSVPSAFVAVLLMGLSLGAELDAVAFLTGHYFGVRHYGLLFGTLMSGTSVAAGAAPLIAGTIFDRTGSYDLLLMGAIPLCLLAAGLIASLGRPPRMEAERI